MGFENIPIIEKPKVVESESKNEKEKVPSSRKKALFVASALGMGVGIYQADKLTEEVIDQAKEAVRVEVPVLKENAMDLKKLNEKFSSRLQIESESGRYIIHVAQVHGQREGYQDTSVRKYLPEVVEKQIQKWIADQQGEIGELAVFLKQQYGVEGFLQEGKTETTATVEELQDAAREIKSEQALASVAGDLEKYESFIEEGISSSEQYEKGIVMFRNLRKAQKLYERELRALQTGGALSKKAWPIASEIPSVENLQENIDKVGAVMDRFEKVLLGDSEFKTKYTYHNGGVRLMERMGKGVHTVVSETDEANATAAAAIEASKYRTQKEKMDALREGVAVNLGAQQLQQGNANYVPIVYGLAHDFSKQVAEYNAKQTNPAYRIGLIRIDNKGMEKFLTEHDLLRFKKAESQKGI